jgi:hypothetical protein
MENSITFFLQDNYEVGGLEELVVYGKFYVTFTDMKSNTYTSNELIEVKSMSDEKGAVTMDLDNLINNKEYQKYYELWWNRVYPKGVRDPETDFLIMGKLYNSSTSKYATKVFNLEINYGKISDKWNESGNIGELKFEKESYPFILTSINNNLNIVSLKEKFKDAESKYLLAKEEYTTNLKNVSIDTSTIFERVAAYEPTSWVYVITRFLELIDGTINPALRFTQNGSMTVENKRLTMIQKTIENLLNLYPDITIEDGEGTPYDSSSTGSFDEWTYFSHSPNGSEVDEIDTNMSLTRGTTGGLYNPVYQSAWRTYKDGVTIPTDNYGKENGLSTWNSTPVGTYWNSDGGDVFGNFTQSPFNSRQYYGFHTSLQCEIGNYILIKHLLMWDTLNNKYYEFIFTSWGEDDGGSFSYFRRELV